MPSYTGRRPWRITFSNGTVWMPDAPGPLKGDIVLEHNSVGAVTGGSLTVEGHLDWPAYSVAVKVEVQDGAGWARLGIGAIGKPESTLSASGKRTTTLPIVGYGELDANGLARLGWRSFPFGVGNDLTTWGTSLLPAQFGETNAALLTRTLAGDLLKAWGVRPDGARVAGHPESGPDPVDIPLNEPGLLVQPARHELLEYVSEYEAHPAERWTPRTYNRGAGDLFPGGVPTWPLLALQHTGGSGDKGYVIGMVDLRNLVQASSANPDLQDVTSTPEAVTVEVHLNIDVNRSENVPDSFRLPMSEDARTIWTYVKMQQDHPELFPSSPPADQAQRDALNQQQNDLYNQYRGDPNVQVWAQAQYDAYRQLAWDEVFAQSTVSLTWAEWLTQSSDPVRVAVLETDPPPAIVGAPPRAGTGSSSDPIAGALGGWAAHVQAMFQDAYSQQGSYSAKTRSRYRLQPQQDGFIRPLASQNAILNMKERTTFAWRFSAPEGLLKQVDPDLPGSYLWAFGVVYSANIEGVTATLGTPVARYFYKGANGDVQQSKNVPGFSVNFISGPTTQGTLNGTLFYGPVKVGGLWVAQSRMVISAQGWRTEFQAGARQ